MVAVQEDISSRSILWVVYDEYAKCNGIIFKNNIIVQCVYFGVI